MTSISTSTFWTPICAPKVPPETEMGPGWLQSRALLEAAREAATAPSSHDESSLNERRNHDDAARFAGHVIGHLGAELGDEPGRRVETLDGVLALRGAGGRRSWTVRRRAGLRERHCGEKAGRRRSEATQTTHRSRIAGACWSTDSCLPTEHSPCRTRRRGAASRGTSAGSRSRMRGSDGRSRAYRMVGRECARNTAIRRVSPPSGLHASLPSGKPSPTRW